jgi:hypothetical protein
MNNWLAAIADSLWKRKEAFRISTPDGVIDLSSVLEPLVELAKRERPYDTSDFGGVAELAALVIFGPEESKRTYAAQDVVVRALIVLALLFKTLSDQMKVMPEELVHKVLQSPSFARLSDHLKIVPYDLDENQEPVARLYDLPVFDQRIQPGRDHIVGFVDRSEMAGMTMNEIFELVVDPSTPREWDGSDFEIVDADSLEFDDSVDYTYGWNEIYEKYLEIREEEGDAY